MRPPHTSDGRRRALAHARIRVLVCVRGGWAEARAPARLLDAQWPDVRPSPGDFQRCRGRARRRWRALGWAAQLAPIDGGLGAYEGPLRTSAAATTAAASRAGSG